MISRRSGIAIINGSLKNVLMYYLRILSGYENLGKCSGCLVIGSVWLMIAA